MNIINIVVAISIFILVMSSVTALNDNTDMSDEERIAEWRANNPDRIIINDSDVLEKISLEDFEAVATSNKTIVVDIIKTETIKEDTPGFTIVAGFVVLILSVIMLFTNKEE